MQSCPQFLDQISLQLHFLPITMLPGPLVLLLLKAILVVPAPSQQFLRRGEIANPLVDMVLADASRPESHYQKATALVRLSLQANVFVKKERHRFDSLLSTKWFVIRGL